MHDDSIKTKQIISKSMENIKTSLNVAKYLVLNVC